MGLTMGITMRLTTGSTTGLGLGAVSLLDAASSMLRTAWICKGSGFSLERSKDTLRADDIEVNC